MNVPFLDLGAAYRELKSDIDDAVHRVMESGWYIFGPEVERFEQEWAKFCQAEHAIGVANGLDALVLSLRALNVGPGDEVIVPSNTYIATWLAVTQVGATIVPVEPDEATYNLKPAAVEAAITQNTKVILPVHLYGLPADMDALTAIAKRRGLYIVEDAAQAHAAQYRNQRIGAHGDLVCWSFYPGKNLGALGDGGAVTTNDEALAAKIRKVANYGSSKKYVNEIAGINSRLDPMQAAILSVKLKHLDVWRERRQMIATRYLEALRDTDLILPHVPDNAVHGWHLFVVRTKDREAMITKLQRAGIGTLIHYPIPPHKQEAYAHLGIDSGSQPLATQLADEVLSLPIGPQMTGVDSVISAIIDG